MKQALSVFCGELRLSVGYGLGPALICPRCGSDYLHSGAVKVYDREEDAAETSVTTVNYGLAATHVVESSKAGNPSSRRQGVAVAFECEECEGPLELLIAQHKGGTFVTWRYAPRLPPRVVIDTLELAVSGDRKVR